MVTMHGSKRRELSQQTHSRGSHAFTQHSYNHVLRSASSAIFRILNRIVIVKVPEVVGANRSTWIQNKPTACPLIGIT